MRRGSLHVLGASLLAEAIVCALFLSNCGVMSSGQCADKATCVESDVGTPPNPTGADVSAGDPETAADTFRPPVDATDARTEIPVEPVSVDAASRDATNESAASADAGGGDASIDANIDALRDANLDVDRDAIVDAFADVPSDAIFMGDTAACGPCMNVCVPSFVPCCIGDGGCGCIEFFYPVLCQ